MIEQDPAKNVDQLVEVTIEKLTTIREYKKPEKKEAEKKTATKKATKKTTKK